MINVWKNINRKNVFALGLILLIFSPTFSHFYNSYAFNHNFHCSATGHENHLHIEHKFFYYIFVVNEDFSITENDFNFTLYLSFLPVYSIGTIQEYSFSYFQNLFIRPPPFIC